MRNRNPDLCRRLRKVIGFRLSFPCSCDSPMTIFTCNVPEVGKQIHACSMFGDYFRGEGKRMTQSLKHEHSS